MGYNRVIVHQLAILCTPQGHKGSMEVEPPFLRLPRWWRTNSMRWSAILSLHCLCEGCWINICKVPTMTIWTICQSLEVKKQDNPYMMHIKSKLLNPKRSLVIGGMGISSFDAGLYGWNKRLHPTLPKMVRTSQIWHSCSFIHNRWTIF